MMRGVTPVFLMIPKVVGTKVGVQLAHLIPSSPRHGSWKKSAINACCRFFELWFHQFTLASQLQVKKPDYAV